MKYPYPGSRERPESDGFSLLEVIVAISLLAIAIAGIIQLYSVNLRSVRKADLYTRAIIQARSIMDETLCMERLEAASENLDAEGGFTVTRTVRAMEDDEDALTRTFEITVNVSWNGGQVELRTLKSVSRDENEE